MRKAYRSLLVTIVGLLLTLLISGLGQAHSTGGLPYTDYLFHGVWTENYAGFPCGKAMTYYGDPLQETSNGASNHEAWGYAVPNCSAGIAVKYYDDRVYTTGGSHSGVVSTKLTLNVRLGATPCIWGFCNSESRIDIWLGLFDVTNGIRYENSVYSDSCGFACFREYYGYPIYPSIAVYWTAGHSYEYYVIVKVSMWAWGLSSASIKTWYTVDRITLQ